MKNKTKILYFFTLLAFMLSNTLMAQEKCMSTILGNQYLEDHPENLGLIQTLNSLSLNYDEPVLDSRTPNIIPVVVHVIGNPSNPESYISYAQIQSQIDILNEDFNAENMDIENVPAEFTSSIGNIGLQFRLANTKPDGTATIGIVSEESENVWGINTSLEDITNISPSWNPEHYLNIWVGDLVDGILGHGTKPGSSDPEQDGVIIGYKYFGDIGTADVDGNRFNLGRTTTHEVGHYLNLEHIWGSQTMDCNSDDNVDDTPLQYNPTLGCPDDTILSCGSNDMYVNFMDYSDDACLLMFTDGQRSRIWATLENYRDQLINSPGYATDDNTPTEQNTQFTVYPNPTRNQTIVSWHSKLFFEHILIHDLYGREVYRKAIDNNGNQLIETYDIPNGIYILSLANHLGSVQKKLSIFH